MLVKDKRDDEDKIKDLQDEIGKIKATRTQLEQVGQAALLTFATNVSAIQKIWTTVVSDAILIKGWLLDGAQFAVSCFYTTPPSMLRPCGSWT